MFFSQSGSNAKPEPIRISFDAQLKIALSKRLNVQKTIGFLMAAVNHLTVAPRLAREVNLKLLSSLFFNMHFISYLLCERSDIMRYRCAWI